MFLRFKFPLTFLSAKVIPRYGLFIHPGWYYLSVLPRITKKPFFAKERLLNEYVNLINLRQRA